MSDATPSESRAAALPEAPTPLLEQIGVRYFQTLANNFPQPTNEDAIHTLTPEEQNGMRRVQRNAILKACLAGCIAAGVASIPEIMLLDLADSDPWRYWGIVGGVVIVVSILEIAYLYLMSLHAVVELAHVAGLDLFPKDDATVERRNVAGALARAALELPNPTQPLFGVDPHEEVSKWQIFMVSLLYKAKVGISNFLIKALVRRAMGRAVVKGWLPLLSVPITAAWNGLVCWRVVREARIRAMGPSAVAEYARTIFEAHPDASPRAKAVALHAVSSTVVRTADLHPNLVELYLEVARRAGDASQAPEEGEQSSRVSRFLNELAHLEPGERGLALDVLLVAAVIDGRLTAGERQLARQAFNNCAVPLPRRRLPRLKRAFLRGEAITVTMLQGV